jgi:four helix bundle protein
MVKGIEDMVVYQKATALANTIYGLVERWIHFHQNTLGTQIVKSADSIAANISEGFGRYHYAEKKSFYYYARGSLLETKTHITLAKNRALINKELAEQMLLQADDILRMLNALIKSTGKMKEPPNPNP